MHSLTGQLAAVMASTDAVPRIVRQSTALFLVTPKGDVWRVFDSHDAATAAHETPTADASVVVSRVFIGSGAEPVVLVYRFASGQSRSIDAEKLYEQLAAAIPET